MVAVITAVLAGSADGLLAAVVSGHSLAAALVVGVVVAATALSGLMRYQNSAWIRSPERRVMCSIDNRKVRGPARP